MSLQVWLPLTKDLRNQGLSNVTVSGGTIDNNGKLGKCYLVNNSNPINIAYSLNQTTEWSYSIWLKLPSSMNNATNWEVMMKIPAVDNTSGSATEMNVSWASYHNIKIYDNGNHQWVWLAPNTNFTYDEWFRLTVTHTANGNGVTGKVYIDSTCVGTFNNTTNPLKLREGTIQIGKWTTTGGFYINDFRLYDHCLSLMEIKELSKGLVLHYPLNRGGWGQENLITGYDTSFLSYPDGAVTLFSNQMNGGAQEIVSNIGGATKCLHLHSNGGNGRQYGTLSATSGKSYIISCDYYSTSSQATPFRGELNGGNYSWAGSNAAAYTTPNKWVRLSFSYLNLTSDATIFYFMQCSQNTDCYIKNLKIEEGSIATPWCPNSSDALATTMGLNGTTEYDCSGFCNNGEKIGALTYTSDTPKYAVSTHIGATNQKIHISNFPTSGFGNSYSFAWWAKVPSFSGQPMMWGFSDGIRFNAFHTGPYWNTGDSQNNPIYSSGTTLAPVPSGGTWHHFVAVGDGSTCKAYLDGQFWGQAKTYKSISGTSIYINGWDSGSSYTFNDLSISDFRIYATALSADDVKSLYQNSAYIDSSGNVYGAVHSEV